MKGKTAKEAAAEVNVAAGTAQKITERVLHQLRCAESFRAIGRSP